MTQATALGQTQDLPAHLQFDQETTNVVEVVDDKKYRAVVFVGDVLPLSVKASPIYKLGGRLFPYCLTIPFQFVGRCAITPMLKDAYASVAASLIDPMERKNYVPSYTKKNVLINPATGKRGDVVIGKKGTMSSHLLFKKVLPASEIGLVAYQNNGVVEITSLTRGQDVLDAQYHYFPDWLTVVRGKTDLIPLRLSQLREFLENRMEKTLSPAMRAVGEAYLQSCDQYEIWGKEYIDQQTSIIKGAEKFPAVVQRYDEIAERLFITLELSRPDNLIKDIVKDHNRQAEKDASMDTALKMLAEGQALMAKILANQQGVAIGETAPDPEAAATVPDPGLSPEQLFEETVGAGEAEVVVEEDQATDDELAGKAKEQDDDEIVLDEVDQLTEEELAIGKCADTNSEGKECLGKIVKKVDGLLYCRYHPRTAPATPAPTDDEEGSKLQG